MLHGLRSVRVHQAAYLARIVFCSMIRRDVAGELGYGISASLQGGQVVLIAGLAAGSFVPAR